MNAIHEQSQMIDVLTEIKNLLSTKPIEKEYWDFEDCAKCLGVTKAFFRDDISLRKGFPKAVDFNKGSSRRDKQRWRPKDIRAWADAQR